MVNQVGQQSKLCTDGVVSASENKKIGIINCNPSVEHSIHKISLETASCLSTGKSNRKAGSNDALRYAKERFQSLINHACS